MSGCYLVDRGEVYEDADRVVDHVARLVLQQHLQRFGELDLQQALDACLAAREVRDDAQAFGQDVLVFGLQHDEVDDGGQVLLDVGQLEVVLRGVRLVVEEDVREDRKSVV